MITASNTECNPDNYPVRAIDETKNKQCPHCKETFYYFDGVHVHIDHAHQDLVAIKGMIETPVDNLNIEQSPDSTESVRGTNIQSALGINLDSTPIRSDAPGTNTSHDIDTSGINLAITQSNNKDVPGINTS